MMSLILAAALSTLSGVEGLAQDSPEFSGTWVNSRDLKLENLKGKIVVVYFFEEG